MTFFRPLPTARARAVLHRELSSVSTRLAPFGCAPFASQSRLAPASAVAAARCRFRHGADCPSFSAQPAAALRRIQALSTASRPPATIKSIICTSPHSVRYRPRIWPNITPRQQPIDRRLPTSSSSTTPLLLAGLLPLAPYYTILGYTQPTIIWGTLATYAALWAAWRVPSLYWWERVMVPHFTSSFYDVVRNRRWHTPITSAFSHHDTLHLVLNSFALLAVASPLLDPAACVAGTAAMTQTEFAAFYLAAAAFSGVGGWFLEAVAAVFGGGTAGGGPRVRVWNALARPGLGGSGAILAAFGATAVLFPQMQFYIIPIPFAISAATLLGVVPCFDIAGLVYNRVNANSGRRSPLGHGAHLAGLLFGVLYAVYVARPALEKRRREAQKRRLFRSGM